MPRIIKGGGNYKELVKDEIFLDFGGKKMENYEAEKSQKENPRSGRLASASLWRQLNTRMPDWNPFKNE